MGTPQELDKQFGDQRQRYKEDGALSGPPFITEETCNVVRKELGMPLHSDKGTTGSKAWCQETYDKGMTMVEKCFEYFQEDGYVENPRKESEFLSQVSIWLDGRFGGGQMDEFTRKGFKNSASVGMVAAIRMFDVQCGPGFVEGLNKANAQELKDAFDKVNGSFTDELTVVNRVRRNRPVPYAQFAFGSFVDDLGGDSAYNAAVQNGLLAMYSVVETLWPTLKTSVASDGK